VFFFSYIVRGLSHEKEEDFIIVHHFLTSDADVNERIRPASAAFDALKNVLTNDDINLKVKGIVNLALCLSILILLNGREMWCLRESLFNRFRHFHHRRARTMCRITITHEIRHRVKYASLFKRLPIELFDTNNNR
jgi:hypothetical protein